MRSCTQSGKAQQGPSAQVSYIRPTQVCNPEPCWFARRLSTGSRYWLAGPFSLGPRLSYINNIVTLAWVLTVTVVFTLPQFYPITLRNMNW